VRDAVRVDEEVPEARPCEIGVEPRFVGAFGKPEPLGGAPEEPAILRGRDLHLRPHGGGVHRQQRQKAVRCPARDDVDQSALLVRAESGDEVLLPLVEKDGAHAVESREVELGDAMEARVAPRAPLLLLRELDEPVEVA